MTDPTVLLLHRWFEEVWNQGREEAIDEMLAVDAVAHGLGDAAGQTLIGPEAFKPFFRRFRAAFPNLQIAIDETITEGDRI
ncbi:MAG: ester cyclase, partial [Pyrinomonadaceae bacterium]